MMTGEKGIPFPGLTVEVIFEKDGVRRFIRLVPERHHGLFGRALTFLGITLFACGNKVEPIVAAAPGSRHHVVDGKVALGAAILALKVVALEYILPGKINALVGGVNISIEADYRRHRIGLGDRMQLVPIGRFDHLAFSQKHKDKGAFNRADHQRTVILIEYQNPVVHVGKIVANFLGTKGKCS